MKHALMRLVRVGLWVLAWLASSQAMAQNVESVLSPGPLVKSHAKWDDSCKSCHVRFDRQAQDRLCADCHKDIGRDLAQRTGMHGRQKPQACRSCHTDHRGRDMKIAEFDKHAFDHQQTDYVLRGKHRETDCGKCHQPQQKFSAAPQECNACHRKDDVHKASLGTACANCHDERSWRETRFDHSVTRFALTGAHNKARCESCHKTRDYKEAPKACVGCHLKEDKHKARFGEKCESCHNTQRWPQITFRHDTDTRYALVAKHRDVRCTSCHTGTLYKEKTGSACIDCHRKDDTHKGSLGQDCVRCHSERGWKESQRFDHDRTNFALLGPPQRRQAPGQSG
ncbi:cytochrome c3 family protein [Caenimonas koreensis]|uniref:cytochrome c3 family protein n=1 Tax=Caenimonas koreensis TaxID=367474 RepID=UPI00378324CE